MKIKNRSLRRCHEFSNNHPLHGRSKLQWHVTESSFGMNPRPLLYIELYKCPNERLFINLSIHFRMEKLGESCFYKTKIFIKSIVSDKETCEDSSKRREIYSFKIWNILKVTNSS